jgi:catechol 2,3-dioxygenase-like lactoylglutathione lyase family enzyme
VIHSLDHVVVAVSDLEVATRDTSALLGREPAWRGTHPEWGTANTLFRLANTYLELLSPQGEGAMGARVAAFLEERGEGVLALAFGTDDAAGCAAVLRARGISIGDPVDGEGEDAASGAVRRWRNAFVSPESSRGTALFAIEHVEGELPDSKPVSEVEASVAALDHVVVYSDDLDATKALYGDGLGLRLALDRSFEARGVRILFFRVGGATVEVGGRLEPEPGTADTGRDRFGGLAWQVPDAGRARARLLEAGFDVSEVRDGFKPGTRVCTVRSRNCGVPTLIIEPTSLVAGPAGGR